jgi:hypothetical protein
MIVNPINETPIPHARIGLQVINSNPSSRPFCDPRIAIINPDFTSSLARRGQVHGYDERPLGGNRSGPFRKTRI